MGRTHPPRQAARSQDHAIQSDRRCVRVRCGILAESHHLASHRRWEIQVQIGVAAHAQSRFHLPFCISTLRPYRCPCAVCRDVDSRGVKHDAMSIICPIQHLDLSVQRRVSAG